MSRTFEHRGNSFAWDEAKAAENVDVHGVTLEEAATVFDDPLFVLKDATRNGESREAAIGFSSTARLLTVVHLPGAPLPRRSRFMLNERLKKRLKKNRARTTITMRIPVDVVESRKAVAPMRGFTAYQTLLKSYISEGLRRDEAQFDQQTARKLAAALKRRGVDEEVIDEALAEIERA
jgi:uncharacterized DUF497 family protein